MKKIIAVAGLGAAVAIGSLVGAGTANASTAGFESVVYSDTGYSGSSVVSLGYTTCDAITTFRQTGMPPAGAMGAVGGIYLDSGISSHDSAYILAASVTELCPSNYSYVMAGVDGVPDSSGTTVA
jgi:hypothetical protein